MMTLINDLFFASGCDLLSDSEQQNGDLGATLYKLESSLSLTLCNYEVEKVRAFLHKAIKDIYCEHLALTDYLKDDSAKALEKRDEDAKKWVDRMLRNITAGISRVVDKLQHAKLITKTNLRSDSNVVILKKTDILEQFIESAGTGQWNYQG